MIKVIIYNLRRHLKSYLGLAVLLGLLLIAFNYLADSLLPLTKSVILYKNMQLDKAICVTTYETASEVAKTAEAFGGEVLFQNMDFELTKLVIDYEGIYMRPVTADYFERFPYMYSDCMSKVPDGNWAVVPKALAGKFAVGKEYTVTLSDNKRHITFIVYAVLPDNLQLCLPTEDAGSDVISRCTNSFFVAVDDETRELFSMSNTYSIDTGSASNSSQIIRAFEEKGGAVTDFAEELREAVGLELEILATPIVLAFVAVLLCFSGLVANIILKTMLNERVNHIYYICGWPWRNCVLVQLICDSLLILCGIAFAVVGVAVLANISLNVMNFAISVGILILMFIIVEVPGLMMMQKGNRL